MITCRLYRNGKLEDDACAPASISKHLEDDGARIWLDIEDPGPDELQLLREQFDFHPLTMEDTEKGGQRPKVEVFDRYFYVVVHAIAAKEDGELVDSEIHILTGKGFLVTLRYRPTYDLSAVKERWARQPGLTSEGAAFLLYALLDEIVDGYFDVIDGLEDIGDEIEDRVFADEPDPDIQEDIFRLKRRVVSFRRLVSPLREVVDRLQELPDFVTPALAPYYRDVLDHVIRASDFIDNIRDLLTSALEAQLSQVSNRMNQVMKSLTSWGAIILVPTLIAGIYGMNFQGMPELHWTVGYPMAIGLMLVSGFSLYVAFKRKGWL